VKSEKSSENKMRIIIGIPNKTNLQAPTVSMTATLVNFNCTQKEAIDILKSAIQESLDEWNRMGIAELTMTNHFGKGFSEKQVERLASREAPKIVLSRK
jgi:hypothetical protein